jgi:DNA-binding IclR family transcriptional regulator
MYVLLSFSEARPTWSVAELSHELELTQSAVYRYIGLLREVGLVDQAPGNRYRLSERTAALAAAANAARAPLGEIALPVVNRLRETIDETVLVARRIGWHAFTVARAESRKPVRLQFEPGQAMRLHIGSMSRILLTSMSEREQERYLATVDESERASEFLTPEARAVVRRDGVTESFEEIDEGIWGVAAAIVEKDEIVGALGCAAPIYRTDSDKRRTIRELIVAGAAEISRSLG